jgi:hypothetical protein
MTARKVGPHLKRGPKPKPKPPKPPAKRSGRKPVSYIGGDRDRHAIALTDALLRLRVAPSENAACDAVAPLRIGVEVPTDHPDGLTRWRKRSEAGIAATFKGYAATLRMKRRKYCDARSMWWRRQMASAFVLALQGTADDKAHALALASSVGEVAFAGSVLFAMIDARFHAAGNTPFISQQWFHADAC